MKLSCEKINCNLCNGQKITKHYFNGLFFSFFQFKEFSLSVQKLNMFHKWVD